MKITYMELPLGFGTHISVLFWGRVSISFIHIIYYPLETLKTVVEVWVGEQRRHLKKYIKKMELPFDLAIPLLGSFSKNPETPIQKNPHTQCS